MILSPRAEIAQRLLEHAEKSIELLRGPGLKEIPAKPSWLDCHVQLPWVSSYSSTKEAKAALDHYEKVVAHDDAVYDQLVDHGVALANEARRAVGFYQVVRFRDEIVSLVLKIGRGQMELAGALESSWRRVANWAREMGAR